MITDDFDVTRVNTPASMYVQLKRGEINMTIVRKTREELERFPKDRLIEMIMHYERILYEERGNFKKFERYNEIIVVK